MSKWGDLARGWADRQCRRQMGNDDMGVGWCLSPAAAQLTTPPRPPSPPSTKPSKVLRKQLPSVSCINHLFRNNERKELWGGFPRVRWSLGRACKQTRVGV